jgi:hypothetical protein
VKRDGGVVYRRRLALREVLDQMDRSGFPLAAALCYVRPLHVDLMRWQTHRDALQLALRALRRALIAASRRRSVAAGQGVERY